MLQGGCVDEAIEGLLQRAGHCGGTTGARAIPQALGPLLRKALPPRAEGGIRYRKGRGDRMAVVTCDDLADRLRPAKDPCLLGLLEQGGSGRQRVSGKVAFEGAHGCAPGKRRLVTSHMTFRA